MKGTELMDRIRDEMAAVKDERIAQLGELLTAYLRRHPDTELDEKKKLKGALEHLKKTAEKKKSGNSYVMGPKEVFGLLLEYCGLKEHPGDMGACFWEVCGCENGLYSVELTQPETKTDAVPDPFDLDALLGGL